MSIEVEPNYSPRISLVPISDGASISMQDLGDGLKEWAQQPQNLSYPNVVTASGKDAIDGGFTGISNILQDAKLAFQQRGDSVANGSCTTSQSQGTLLIDTAGGFETANIQPGALVCNFTDKSVSTIYTRLSNTEVLMYPLEDGAINEWTSGDEYKIWQPTECVAGDGNLSAVDKVGSTITPIMPTWGTFPTRVSSTSPTLTVTGSGVTPGDVDDIAAAVWNALLTAHTTPGTFGYWLQRLLTKIQNLYFN